MAIKIYESDTSGNFSVVYTTDHCNNFEIKKSTGIIPFSLPLISGTANQSTEMIGEQTEFIHLSGVEANVSMDFEIGMSDINTLLGLVTNYAYKSHRIEIGDWSGYISNYTMDGIIDNIRIRQEGGDPRLSCNLTFLRGFNPLHDLGY